jgi:hypothetical protein
MSASATPRGSTAAAAHGVSAVAIPYFQWDNRGPGAMRVWVPAPDR